MNKKLISNSLNVLYAKVGQCRNKALVTEISTYLMMAVYKMFRLLYTSGPHNAASMFSISEGQWDGYSDADHADGRGQRQRPAVGRQRQGGRRRGGHRPAGHDHREPDPGVPPLYFQLLNLVKTSETRIRSLTPPEENGK